MSVTGAGWHTTARVMLSRPRDSAETLSRHHTLPDPRDDAVDGLSKKMKELMGSLGGGGGAGGK